MPNPEAKKLAKPKLRGLLHAQIKQNLIIGIGLTISAGLAFKLLVVDCKRKKYAEFYKNYDADAEFQKMKKLGLFQSG